MKPQFRKTLKSFRLTDMRIRPSFISGSGEQLYEAVMDLETPDNPKRYVAICQTPGPEDTSEPCPPRSLHNCKIMDLAVSTSLSDEECCTASEQHLRYERGQLLFVYDLWDEKESTRRQAMNPLFVVKIVWIPRDYVM